MRQFKAWHFWVGALGLVAFLLTGLYMDQVHDHLRGMADRPRMLFRAAHIYFLLASLINLVLGVYMDANPRRWAPRTASLLILLAAPLLLLAFFTEPLTVASLDEPRATTQAGLYALFGSGALLLLDRLIQILRAR